MQLPVVPMAPTAMIFLFFASALALPRMSTTSLSGAAARFGGTGHDSMDDSFRQQSLTPGNENHHNREGVNGLLQERKRSDIWGNHFTFVQQQGQQQAWHRDQVNGNSGERRQSLNDDEGRDRTMHKEHQRSLVKRTDSSIQPGGPRWTWPSDDFVRSLSSDEHIWAIECTRRKVGFALSSLPAVSFLSSGSTLPFSASYLPSGEKILKSVYSRSN